VIAARPLRFAGRSVPPWRAPGLVELRGKLLFELAQLAGDGRVLKRAQAREPPAEPGDRRGGGRRVRAGAVGAGRCGAAGDGGDGG